MLHWILTDELIFPHPLSVDIGGPVALGGDLSPERLLLAYSFGIFPWYNEFEPIIWWFPDPRAILRPEAVRVSGSMRALVRKAPFTVATDTCFRAVVEQCRTIPRRDQRGTWIQPEIVDAYCTLHAQGYAHSIEVFQNGTLVGGLYGVALGKVFFGESMFSAVPNASKYALIVLGRYLESRGFEVIDCQQHTKHLASMGAGLVSAETFYRILQRNRLRSPDAGKWRTDMLPLLL